MKVNNMMPRDEETKIKSERKIKEILDILQEECAEVVQAVSKCRRFGLTENRDKLVQELADVSLLIELLHAYQLYTHTELHLGKNLKAQKLTKYSTIYED
jgi:NTP pyrophosphatase (non-canonical NTP hydrolase)